MDQDEPFPRLFEKSIPLGLSSLMKAARQEAWRRRGEPGYWSIGISDKLEQGIHFQDVATFIMAIRCFGKWQKSEERELHYKRASKRAHYVPKGIPGVRPILAPTVYLYSERGGQRLEALAALGFALRSGKKKHSLRLWRPFSLAIYRGGLGDAESTAPNDERASEAVDRYFRNIRSRLNTASEELGCEDTVRQARRVFSALRLAAGY
jgi:hypothetical protein